MVVWVEAKFYYQWLKFCFNHILDLQSFRSLTPWGSQKMTKVSFPIPSVSLVLWGHVHIGCLFIEPNFDIQDDCQDQLWKWNCSNRIFNPLFKTEFFYILNMLLDLQTLSIDHGANYTTQHGYLLEFQI